MVGWGSPKVQFHDTRNYQPQDRPCYMGHRRSSSARVVFTRCSLALHHILLTVGPTWVGRRGLWDCERIRFLLFCSQ